MTYEKIYNNIIENRKINKVFKKTQYCEVHHIVPRSFGGSDDITNKVTLTGREHVVVHRLLVKIALQKYGKSSVQYQKMCCALWRMTHKAELRINSRTYEHIRLTYGRMQSERMKGINNPQYKKPSSFKGRHHTEITKQKLSNDRKGKYKLGKDNPMHGHSVTDFMTDEEAKLWKQHISEGTSGKNNPMYGKDSWEKCDETQRIERKNKVSKAFKGRKRMYHPTTLHRVFVKPNEFNKYLELGYIFGYFMNK